MVRTLSAALLVSTCSLAVNGLTDDERDKCNRKAAFVRENYELCCGMGKYMDRDRICEKAWKAIRPKEDDDTRSPSWPKLSKGATAGIRPK